MKSKNNNPITDIWTSKIEPMTEYGSNSRYPQNIIGYKLIKENVWEKYIVTANSGGYLRNDGYYNTIYRVKDYTLTCKEVLNISDGNFTIKTIKPKDFINISKTELISMDLQTIYNNINNKTYKIEF